MLKCNARHEYVACCSMYSIKIIYRSNSWIRVMLSAYPVFFINYNRCENAIYSYQYLHEISTGDNELAVIMLRCHFSDEYFISSLRTSNITGKAYHRGGHRLQQKASRHRRTFARDISIADDIRVLLSAGIRLATTILYMYRGGSAAMPMR